MIPDDLLGAFHEAADGVSAAVGRIPAAARLAITERPSQYALDLVADGAVLDVLGRLPVAVVSEESGQGGKRGAPVTVVVDPVDGSTNCSRGIPYWATSLAAVDGEGLLAALVVNQATGERFAATRGRGAVLDGEPVRPTGRTDAADSLVSVLAGERFPHRPWRKSRLLGAAALELCEVAAGRLDGFVDGLGRLAPWDYLGALLVCREAGVEPVDARGRELVVTEPSERRQVVAGSTPALLDELLGAFP